MDKEEAFSSQKPIGVVGIFLDNYHFIKAKNLKTSLN